MAEEAKVAAHTHELAAEGVDVTEEVFINEAGEAVDFEEGVLEWGGSEKDFFTLFQGPSNALAHFIAGAVAVLEFVGLIDGGKIKGDTTDFFFVTTRKRVGANDDLLGVERARVACFDPLLVFLGVEYGGGEIELFLQLDCPLFTNGSGADDEDSPFLFGPELAQNDACFDGLS